MKEGGGGHVEMQLSGGVLALCAQGPTLAQWKNKNGGKESWAQNTQFMPSYMESWARSTQFVVSYMASHSHITVKK